MACSSPCCAEGRSIASRIPPAIYVEAFKSTPLLTQSFRGGKSTPLAAELDTLARRYRLLLIVSAGNIDHATLITSRE